MNERANANVAAKAIAQWHHARQDRYHVEEARIALEAIDPRLADLTPEDVTAILNFIAILAAELEADHVTLTGIESAIDRCNDAASAIAEATWRELSR